MRYFLELSYNGTPYHGWQRQPNAISVQEVLENSLSLLLKSKIDIVGAGRTDAGVHAKQIMAHFDNEDELDVVQFRYKLNSLLPKEISIKEVSLVSDDAHARFDAISRSYEYFVTLYKDPFSIDSAYYLKKELDVDLMNEAAKLLLNYTSFKCFSKSKTDVKTYNCTITRAVWEMNDNKLIFKISANRFLRNMVRAIVGTLIEIGEHKLGLEDLERIIKSENRSEAGYSVPAHGLYLTEVQYPKTIYCKK
ncbi:tRNA pseudouridine(38-40) synthase TruA [Aquimarina sp. MMG015]|uniref:tRNA pseudouridine(38-40) synthase TruA n=1 Tax=unclassified Aquimarina TaxID=2627091 RepID=UPI000E483BA9|nr:MULTISPECIES: tRNA pseudouridine(38-40) synthase TruA [unclassified Aquimarina]AXT56352.1 tRNA pseudouridine(38-40) synthase TruA [Aquimarina sp. AD1]MBQ4803535.1 tRNA pseudouridine(38-40) synthase TruA [Aquimarina sp. MMG015]RKN20616.1 tRNA pseudouridine(38-40) synthase TruA [Aquimarina sp. AD1]